MACFTYIIGSSGGSGKNGVFKTYVGWTTNLERRLSAHNAGTGARSTRGRQWVLLYSESYKTQKEAMSREWHLKRDRKFRQRLRDTISPGSCKKL